MLQEDLRVRFQQQTEQAIKERQEKHQKLVKKYILDTCSEAVQLGNYETDFTFKRLSDGIAITGDEVKEFADAHNLTYTPPNSEKKQPATISWYPVSK